MWLVRRGYFRIGTGAALRLRDLQVFRMRVFTLLSDHARGRTMFEYRGIMLSTVVVRTTAPAATLPY